MFEEYRYLNVVRDFLLTFPYPTPYDDLRIDHGEIIERQDSDRFGTGAALSHSGTNSTNTKRSVTGRTTERNRTNFALIMWRDTNDDDFRRDISSFLTRLINWVKSENALRRKAEQNPTLPHFSMTLFEKISASGGIRTAKLEDGRTEFQILIHCDYDLIY